MTKMPPKTWVGIKVKGMREEISERRKTARTKYCREKKVVLVLFFFSEMIKKRITS